MGVQMQGALPEMKVFFNFFTRSAVKKKLPALWRKLLLKSIPFWLRE
jgi:hypothetical protein